MFSGAGLYQEDVFFGLLFRDTLYFKVNDSNRPDYEARGMAQFKPYEDRPKVSFHYYEVPAEVLEDRDELVVWARRSVEAAAAIAAAKAAKKRTKRANRKSPKRKQAERKPSPGKPSKRAPAKRAKRQPPKPKRTR
jgi:DNA transformation protein